MNIEVETVLLKLEIDVGYSMLSKNERFQMESCIIADNYWKLTFLS